MTNPDPAARNPAPGAPHRHTAQANPFTYFERTRLLQAAVQAREWAGGVTIVPLDLTRPGHWADYVPLTAHQYVRAYTPWEREKAAWLTRAGYATTLLEGDAAHRISAASIRDSLRTGDDRWRTLALPATIPLLEAFIAETPMQDRR